MRNLLENKARIRYDNKSIETCKVTTLIEGEMLAIHKRAITSGIDQDGTNIFARDEIFSFQIELINYGDKCITGKVLKMDGTQKVTAIEVVDNIPAGLKYVNGSIRLFINEVSITLNQINNINSYYKGDYSFIIVGNKLTVLMPEIPGNSNVAIVFNVENDGTLNPGDCVLNYATVDYKENPYDCPVKSEEVEVKYSFVELVAKKKGPVSVRCGEIFSYAISIMNIGNLTANNVVITDQLPAQFRIDCSKIKVTLDGSILILGSDYSVSIINNLLTIRGANSKDLQIPGGKTLNVTIPGQVDYEC